MKKTPLKRKTPLKARGSAKRAVSLPEPRECASPLRTSRPRKSRSKATPLRSSANGEQCTLNIAGVCTYQSETVVLCHLPFLVGAGMGQKAPDYCACYGCSACHDALDGRGIVMPITEKLFYASRALVRTLARMVETGLIKIKGMAHE